MAAKLESGFGNEQEAFEIGRVLLYENAARLFAWRERKTPSQK